MADCQIDTTGWPDEDGPVLAGGGAEAAMSDARRFAQSTAAVVTSRIKYALCVSEGFRDQVANALDEIGTMDFDPRVFDPPAVPEHDMEIDGVMNLPEIGPTSFGTVNATIPGMPAMQPVPGVPDITIPDFAPSVTSFNPPQRPTPTAPVSPPTRPDIDTSIDLPDAPAFVLPNLPVLDEIVIPDFDFPVMPEFTQAEPQFEGSPLLSEFQWAKETYTPEILPEVIERIRRMMAGEGLPPDVERAMFARAADREALAVRRTLAEIETEFSARGFALPTGTMRQRLDAAREDSLLKQMTMNRDLTIESAKWVLENVRFAVQQGLAAEQVLADIWRFTAAQVFEAAKLQFQFYLEVYNAQVALFNARQNAYQAGVQVWRTRIDAEMQKIAVFKAEVDAELARGELNKQKVATFTALIDAMKVRVQMYAEEMAGAKVKSDAVRNIVEVFRADVAAYGEQIEADKAKFQAYEAEVRAEASKAGIVDAEARAYSALIQGKSAQADIGIKRAENAVQQNRALLEQYGAMLDAVKADIAAQSATIDASAKAYTADTQRYAAVAGAEGERLRVLLAGEEAEMRSNVALFEARMRAYVAAMEHELNAAKLRLGAITSAGELAATAAAGAMAGVSVSAGIDGGGRMSGSGSISESHSYSY